MGFGSSHIAQIISAAHIAFKIIFHVFVAGKIGFFRVFFFLKVVGFCIPFSGKYSNQTYNRIVDQSTLLQWRSGKRRFIHTVWALLIQTNTSSYSPCCSSLHPLHAWDDAGPMIHPVKILASLTVFLMLLSQLEMSDDDNITKNKKIDNVKLLIVPFSMQKGWHGHLRKSSLSDFFSCTVGLSDN